MLNKLRAFYGGGPAFENWWADEGTSAVAAGKYRVIENTSMACLVETVGTPTEGGSSIPAPVFDHVLRQVHHDRLRDLVAESTTYEWVAHGLPKLMVDNRAMTPEQWARLIKVQPTYLMGSRVRDLWTHWKPATGQEVQQVLERKRQTYPDISALYLEVCRELDAGHWYLLVCGHGETMLHEMLCSVSIAKSLLYGHVMNVTTDDVLRRRYKPAVASHWMTARLAHELGIQTVDFGMFYPYKSIFGLEPVMVPGLRWRSE